ncbi:MAG: hypothetical protein JXB85_12445 [Anaerolineales bacterium]|nr:hypothetical protein [Anaerolineales bacterium]
MPTKNPFPTRADPLNLPRRLRDGLVQVRQLLEEDALEDAFDLLVELNERHPDQPQVLLWIADVSLELDYSKDHLRAMCTLHRLMPDYAPIKFGTAIAYMINGCPFACLQMVRALLKRWPQHDVVKDAHEIKETIEPQLPELLKEIGLDQEADLAFACQLDQAKIHLLCDETHQAKQQIKKLCVQKPDYAAPLVLLGDVHWQEGNLPEAVAALQQALACAPEDFRILDALIQYLFLSGRPEEAASLATSLKQIAAADALIVSIVAETLVLIGDDDGMLDLSKAIGLRNRPQDLDEWFYHYLAAAEAMTGDENAARSDWERSLALNPGFPPAVENLAELEKPAKERIGIWACLSTQIIPQKTLSDLASLLDQVEEENSDATGSIRQALHRFLDRHPQISRQAPLLLERGDFMWKEYLLDLADLVGHPELLSGLREFAYGQKGAAALRFRAARVLSRTNAGPTGIVKMWVEHQWKPTVILGYDIRPEHAAPMEPKAAALALQAIDCLLENDGKLAEDLLKEALEFEPENPSLINNLSMAYMLQDKDAEADAVLGRLVEDFPEYFMGQMALARKSIQMDDPDTARSILTHWMEGKKTYQPFEFDMLCKTQLDLLIQEGSLEDARPWLDEWEASSPDESEILFYRERLNGRKALPKPESSRRKQPKPKTKE